MPMFYFAGYKCPNDVAFRANRGLAIGDRLAHVGGTAVGHIAPSSETDSTHCTPPKSKTQCEIGPTYLQVRDWNRATLRNIKRWELMGLECREDREVADSRASRGLVPLTSKEMIEVRNQGRDPAEAFMPELGDIDGRCLNLEGVDPQTAKERIFEWTECTQNRAPGTSIKEIFAGQSRLGTPPLDEVFVGWNEAANKHFRTEIYK